MVHLRNKRLRSFSGVLLCAWLHLWRPLCQYRLASSHSDDGDHGDDDLAADLYHHELADLDVHSEQFASLPPETQHDLLLEKQRYNKYTYHHPSTLPQVMPTITPPPTPPSPHHLPQVMPTITSPPTPGNAHHHLPKDTLYHYDINGGGGTMR